MGSDDRDWLLSTGRITALGCARFDSPSDRDGKKTAARSVAARHLPEAKLNSQQR